MKPTAWRMRSSRTLVSPFLIMPAALPVPSAKRLLTRPRGLPGWRTRRTPMADKAYALPFDTAADLLQRYQIPLARMKLVRDAALLEDAAAEIGYPVALKAISPAFSHKSDHSLVQLGLATPQALHAAAQSMLSILASQPLEGFLIQEMVSGAVEVIAGITYDAQFGPLVVFGSGGTLVELFDDAVMRVPPLTG